MNRFASCGLLLLLGTSGCAFDKQAATSGQIGCPPSKIVISDEERNPTSLTWTASCGDDIYYCSLVGTGEHTSQASCHAASHPPASNPAIASTAPTSEAPVAAASVGAAPVGAAPADPNPADPSSAEHGPPKAVAGFTFGSSVAEASTACTEHGYQWEPGAQDHFRCSSTPVSLGIDAVPTVRFCADKLCAVSLEVSSHKAWLTAYAKFTDLLTKKYGRPASSKGQLRSNCATEAEFEACVMTGGMKLARDWKWDAGAKISLRLVPGQGEPEMTVVYIRQEQPARPEQPARREERALVPGAL